MESLFTTVKNIIIFLILSTVIMNLLGKSSFKQYFNIFSGMILILIVIKPVLGWLDVDGRMDFYFGQNQFKMNLEEVNKELYNAGESQKQKVLDQYKVAIKEQITNVLLEHELKAESIEIQIEEDTTKDSCGEVEYIEVIANEKVGGEQKVEKSHRSEVNPVDKVTIDKITINKDTINKQEKTEETENTDTFDTVLELSVKKEIVGLFGMDMDKISVDIVE